MHATNPPAPDDKAGSPTSDPRGTGETEGTGFAHDAVMVAEVVELFGPVPAGLVVDATVGGGGHSDAILAAHPHLEVLGLDRDDEALAAARRRLARHGGRVVLRRQRFDRLDDEVTALGRNAISGFLFDLGVSSPQLDRPERGFSYREPGPLDMRMDRRQPVTAAELVNEADESTLADLLARYGDERYARRIARAIVAARPVTDTVALAAVIRDAIPAPARREGGHPAKRSFQALRMAVNEEAEQLPVALERALDLLTPGGRGAVLAYHSGEDRVVKAAFAAAAGLDRRAPRRLPVTGTESGPYRLVWRGGRTPGPVELARNPRAASARLRAIERTEAA